MKLSREEVNLIAQAVEEFRDESGGPHIARNRADAERIRRVLRESKGNTFELRALDEEQQP